MHFLLLRFIYFVYPFSELPHPSSLLILRFFPLSSPAFPSLCHYHHSPYLTSSPRTLTITVIFRCSSSSLAVFCSSSSFFRHLVQFSTIFPYLVLLLANPHRLLLYSPLPLPFVSSASTLIFHRSSPLHYLFTPLCHHSPRLH